MNPTTPVVQMAQPGYDVRNCPDWAYLFNSSWPSLAIAFEVTLPTPLPTKIAHNLGFPPLVIGWAKYGTQSYGRVPSLYFKVDATYIYFPPYAGDSITVRAFNIDISKEQSYPLPHSANAKLPYNDQFGIKVAKSGDNRLIYSNNLNDFVIHSRAQSPAVLQVATEKGQYFTNVNPGSQYSGPFLVYPLKTNYIPWAIGVAKIFDGTYQFYSINGLQVINNQLVFPLNGNTAGSLIVLRDPLFYPNVVRVVY
jgi:hypothetical protein